MIVFRSWRSASILVPLALGACAGMSEGPAPIGIVTDTQTARIRLSMQDECLNRASARPFPDEPGTGNETMPALPVGATPEELRIRRNNLVTAYMTATDINYAAFERDLLAFSRQNDLGASLAIGLLSAIGAASGSQALSSATNITSGAVTTTQGAFAKSLLNQTVSVLQTHMRASRAAQYAVIIGRLERSYADWNTCLALSDAIAYEHAGTLNAALAAMAASASDEEEENTATAREAINRVAYAVTPLAETLRDYFGPADDALMATRIGKAQALLTAAGLAVPAGMTPAERLMRILDGANAAESRALAIAVMQDETVDAAEAPIVRALAQGNGRVAYTVNLLADALRGYFAPQDEAVITSRIAQAKTLLASASLAVPAGMTPEERLMRVLDGSNAAELRALALAVLQAESDQSAKAPIVRALTQGD
jgi:hypothetical protein